MDKQDMDHLGDGVYAGHDGCQVWLTVNDHRNEELVALDPYVLQALVRYAKQHLGLEIK
jgi:hypothetical protein